MLYTRGHTCQVSRIIQHKLLVREVQTVVHLVMLSVPFCFGVMEYIKLIFGNILLQRWTNAWNSGGEDVLNDHCGRQEVLWSGKLNNSLLVFVTRLSVQ